MKRASLALLLTLLFTASAWAGEDPEGDKIMHDYVLTMPKVKAYDAAVVALYNAQRQDPAFKAESDAMTKEPSDTVGQLRAKMDRHPRVLGYFKGQGLNRDDAALLPFVLLDACGAAQDPKAPADSSVSPEQITFCKANQAEIQHLQMFNLK